MKNLSNENIIHINKDRTEYIQFKKLLEYPEINHCYTLRKNGLNFAKNDSVILHESYNKICNSLKLEKENIVKPHQTHTDKVEIVEKSIQVFNEVDGLATNKKDIILCTTSADCTSLIFYDPIKKVIGNVHSGWRGTVQMIGQKAIQRMIDEYKCNANNIICCICPHIRKCHFEVKEDVMELFKKEFENILKLDQFIENGRIINGIQKYNIDTTLINITMLEKIGLRKENIIDSEICTVCESEYFHSYRKDKEVSGRNAAIITLK